MDKVKFRKVVAEPTLNELNLLLAIALFFISIIIFGLSQSSVEIPRLAVFIMGCGAGIIFLGGLYLFYTWDCEREVYWVRE